MRSAPALLLLTSLSAYSAYSAAPAHPAHFGYSAAYDIVLKNGRVVDGTGSPWFTADVAIRGDAIAKIAPSIDEPATRVIDVHGNVIAPGFIDIHTHARRGIGQVPTAP